MDNSIWMGMNIIKEIVAAMNRSGKSQEEEERIRQIMQNVLTENSTSASASESVIHTGDLVNRMMQLLEQNMTKQTAELHATVQERDLYKVKMEELNRSMNQLMMNQGAHASEGERSGFTPRQRKLAEMLQELQEMRESKLHEQRTPGEPFTRGGNGGGGGGGGYGARRPQNQGHAQGAFSKFSRQDKGDALFGQGKHPYNQNKGKSTENLEMVDHAECKPGGFQDKPFQRKQYQKYPEQLQTFPQYGDRYASPHFSNTVSGHDHGSHSDNRPKQHNTNSEFSNRAETQNKQYHGPNRGYFQRGGQFHKRGQFQQPRGQFQPQHGQFHPQHGQFHPQHGQFPPQHGQFQPQHGQFQPQHGQFQPQHGQFQPQHGQFQPQHGQFQPQHGQFQPQHGQFQPQHGQFQPQHGQFQPQHGQFQPQHGQLHRHRGQLHNSGQGQKSHLSESPSEFSNSQLTPEEIEAIKAVLKQQQQDKKPSSTPLVVNPSKTTFKKKKPKKPKAAKNTISANNTVIDSRIPDDSEEEDEKKSDVKSSENDGESADSGATGGNSITDPKKKPNSKKKQKSKDQTAAQQKPIGLSELELFVASGLDLPQTSNLNMNDKVEDLMLIGKESDGIVTCQPQTVKELTEFKQRYPNAQVIIVKTSEQK
ncbi:uncharacterized protein LOC110838492 isoform X2 [Zootermopsis nevadensis]|nr:uncharacterized protein LOC110838492 isoform X2 [Zootermopsis nevadensis]XP_021937408.1 uncharacterized protein LOC110838492 isoform X2 [Zootermopsis nevadensis]XP_021937409.1 uncharacterized protein LOC110838492 isoform X2 [Zootermopsis nevadensis]XP_021937410.1 uncharacterized protein LOC110838492 isoform X2 [Zootermopsis nevadensis]XP_021937411.1 uncharacterized protein LOC110838492 isoform X2 [Zootermopsis nevadensis]